MFRDALLGKEVALDCDRSQTSADKVKIPWWEVKLCGSNNNSCASKQTKKEAKVNKNMADGGHYERSRSRSRERGGWNEGRNTDSREERPSTAEKNPGTNLYVTNLSFKVIKSFPFQLKFDMEWPLFPRGIICSTSFNCVTSNQWCFNA